MEKLDELFRQNPNLERLMRPDVHELAGLADSIQDLRTARDGDPESVEINFQLAAALISHSRKSYIEEGVRLMETLVCRRWQSNWSEVVGNHSLLPSNDVPSIARGVAISKATAPPPSDDEEDADSIVEVSEDSASEVAEESGSTSQRGPPPLAPSQTQGAASSSSLLASTAPGSATDHQDRSKIPQVPSNEATQDADVSKIRPGRIDDLALYHYYLTLGWIKLREMEKARSCVGQMLLLAPENKQGKALKTYIEVADRQDTAIDAATVASISLAIAGVATIAGAFFRGRQSSSS